MQQFHMQDWTYGNNHTRAPRFMYIDVHWSIICKKKKKKKNCKQIMVITIWNNTITEPRFICPMHSETKQYQHVRVWAEKSLLQGHTRRQEAHARQTLNSLKEFRKAFLKVRWGRGAVGCHKLLGAAIFHSCRLGHDIPVNLQQNKCHSLFYNFLSPYE